MRLWVVTLVLEADGFEAERWPILLNSPKRSMAVHRLAKSGRSEMRGGMWMVFGRL